MDELDLVEDSDPEDDLQDEFELPPPLPRHQSQASSSTPATQDGRGRTPGEYADPAAAMPTPTLGPNDESDTDCIKVCFGISSCVATPAKP
jgi:hypothetical protein